LGTKTRTIFISVPLGGCAKIKSRFSKTLTGTQPLLMNQRLTFSTTSTRTF
jgi:hypothetical protein